MNMTLGTKLYNLRNRKNLSQAQIAEKLGVSQTAYNKWESDATKPGIDNLLNISEFFETDIYDLLQDVSNVSFSNNKFDKSNIFNHSIQPTINMHSPEVLESIVINQEKITLLIESQNKLITALLENKK